MLTAVDIGNVVRRAVAAAAGVVRDKLELVASNAGVGRDKLESNAFGGRGDNSVIADES